jgi:phosphoglycolate phosphatase
LTPRLVVFDLDGTLADAAEDLTTAANALVAEIHKGAEPLSVATVRRFIGEGAAVLVGRILSAYGIETPRETLLPRFLEHYKAHLLDRTHLYPGILEALDALSGTPLAVLTNKPGDLSRTILEGLGIAPRFFATLGGGDVAERKPDPGGLLSLVERTGIAPREAVMVGDSPVDVQTGRSAGTRTLGCLYGFDPQGVEDARPDRLATSPADIPRLLRDMP